MTDIKDWELHDDSVGEFVFDHTSNGNWNVALTSGEVYHGEFTSLQLAFAALAGGALWTSDIGAREGHDLADRLIDRERFSLSLYAGICGRPCAFRLDDGDETWSFPYGAGEGFLALAQAREVW